MRPGRLALAPLLGLAALGLALSGCGYALSAGLRLQGGASQAEVRPFENRSSDPAAGIEVTAALRQELVAGQGSQDGLEG